MDTNIVSKQQAINELLEKSRLNIIQIEKILGGRQHVDRKIIELAIAVSKRAEEAAGSANNVTRPSVPSNKVYRGKNAVPLGMSRAENRSRSAKPVRVQMGKGIKKAVSFVDSEALV
tara:strand:- start:4200 stop:4550 length:351 start_codon:yes stop_codon:yes gene_type:complete